MESIKKTVGLLAEFLRLKGFNRNQRDKMIADLIDTCSKYYEPHFAMENVLDLFQQEVKTPFSEAQFIIFLETIDPIYISQQEIEQNVTIHGEGTYQQRKKKFLRDQKEMNRHDPDRIRDTPPLTALTTEAPTISAQNPVYRKTHHYA